MALNLVTSPLCTRTRGAGHKDPATRPGLARVPPEPGVREDLGRHSPSDQEQPGKPSTNRANRDPNPPALNPALSGMDLAVLLHSPFQAW